MTEAQLKLLLTVANCLRDDPSACKRIWDGLAWEVQDAYRGYGDPASEMGAVILDGLIHEVESEGGQGK